MARKKTGCCGCFSSTFILALICAAAAYYFVGKGVFNNALDSKTEQDNLTLLIPSGATNEKMFKWVAKKKNYPNTVKAGKYQVNSKWGLVKLIDHLRAGKQEPIRLTINNIRTKEELAGRVSQYLEVDSLTLLNALASSTKAEEFGFTKESFPSMFLANTYEMYWNTTADDFLGRMKKEYDRFWTPENLAKANALNLNKHEVITLASIVEEETKKKEEMPIVAGLYLNRVRKDWPLEADPTLKFALGDFSIKRVLNIHKETDSPYNTYKNAGLPPGPIRIPELYAIDAVLNPADHDYMFMCAKADFSGYHAFARTLSEHNTNARKYQNALNQRGIY